MRRRWASVVTLTAYLCAFVQPDLRVSTVSARASQVASGEGAGTLAETLGLGAATDRSAVHPGLARPAVAGLPGNMDLRSPLSTAVMAAVGGRGTQFSEVSLYGDWDGREDSVADHASKVDDLSSAELDIDATLTRTAISEHTAANGFNENVYYYGDSVGNVFVGVDTNPIASLPSPVLGGVDSVVQLSLPAILSQFSQGGADDQVVVTGLCVNPVADLSSFFNVNPSYGPFNGRTGEILYITFTDTGAGTRTNASNQPIRSGLLAVPIADGASPALAPPEIQSPLGFPVIVGGPIPIAFSIFSNLAGCAVDDDGSVYFQNVDLQQFTGANIVKATDVGSNQDRSLAVTGTLTINSLSPFQGLYSTTQGPATQVNRFTSFSGNSATFGNITALAAGPGNTLYAAVAGSNDGTAATGLFANAPTLGATPSMIISFADAIGQLNPTPGVVVPDGFADAAAGAAAPAVGLNNFRVFALGSGPDRRAAAGVFSPIFGTVADTLKLDFQIDYTIYGGIAVSEDRQVFVISGGTPAGVGRDPSPTVSEILAFPDNTPADRRADFIDWRGNNLPNPPASGGNFGDGDSDRFDHIYMVAPFDAVTVAPTGLAGISRGFLRYTNRQAPLSMSTAVALGQTIGTPVQGDNTTVGPIFFGGLDPGQQVGGGDDQNSPFRGDDSDGGGFPVIVGAREGGFEFAFGGMVGGICTAPWNAFFLNSNGSVSFSVGSTDNTPDATEFLTGPPRIAGAWGDLNPAARATNSNQFPVQALGFAGVNQFKVRWINVPRAGQEAAGSRNTFSIAMYDDGTGPDENANQPTNPANPIGNNTVPFDQAEGPTDLQFAIGAAGQPIGTPPRPQGSAQMRLEYGWMDSGAMLNGFIAGYSTATGAGAGSNLSEIGRFVLVGSGVEQAAVFEQFIANDWDLRAEGNDAAASTPAGQPNASLEVITFLGKACAPSQLFLNVATSPVNGGSVTGFGIACQSDCFELLLSGATEVLTATPAAGFVFSGWTGCDAPTGNVCTLTMTTNKSVMASFVAQGSPQPFRITLNSDGFTTGQVMTATVTLDPALAGPGPVDAYVALQVPGGLTLSLQPPLGTPNFVVGIAPLATGFTPVAVSGPILSVPLSGIPVGTYTFTAGLTQSGTANVIGSLSTASFTFTP